MSVATRIHCSLGLLFAAVPVQAEVTCRPELGLCFGKGEDFAVADYALSCHTRVKYDAITPLRKRLAEPFTARVHFLGSRTSVHVDLARPRTADESTGSVHYIDLTISVGAKTWRDGLFAGSTYDASTTYEKLDGDGVFHGEIEWSAPRGQWQLSTGGRTQECRQFQ
jgi:hypothetical protein